MTMAITMKDVRVCLDPDEVDYDSAKKLGPAAIPFLLELVKGGDLGLASKATYLASLIKSEQSAAVLEAAAKSKEALLRVAAASGLRNLSKVKAEKILDLLINDPDAGIRKVVLKSVDRFKSPQLAAKLQQMAEKDLEPFVRDLAARAVRTMKGGK
jgi:HEAT repeat protein